MVSAELELRAGAPRHANGQLVASAFCRRQPLALSEIRIRFPDRGT